MTSKTPWTVYATFYAALILSLAAVSIGSQQTITLFRLGHNRDGLESLQKLLRKKADPHIASKSQLYLWQLPVMLLNVSILLFIIGLIVIIWSQAAQQPGWNDEMKARQASSQVTHLYQVYR